MESEPIWRVPSIYMCGLGLHLGMFQMQIFEHTPFENSKLSLTSEVGCVATIHASNIQGNI